MPHNITRNDDVHGSTRLVVGGNGGIGLALVKAQLARPDVSKVIATHRATADIEELTQLGVQNSGKLLLHKLDVTNEASLMTFSRFLALQPTGIDLAIHTAGLLHDKNMTPEKSLAQCSSTNLMRLFELNSIGPLMVAQALLPTQKRGHRFTFAALSAMVGSITDNRLGGWYGYRASKTALNQFIKTMAIECRVKYPRAAIVAIHPGTTDTGLSRPFQNNVSAGKLYTPEQTATRLLGVLEEVNEKQSGQFLNWNGTTIPW
jgi:NAD(P)-dependent dehydrogenase (short-subunit alcohol dehydrogenase family)